MCSIHFVFFFLVIKSISMTLISSVDGVVSEMDRSRGGSNDVPDFIVFDTSLIIYSVYLPPRRWMRWVIVAIWMTGRSRGTLAGTRRLWPSKFSIVSLYTPPSLPPLKRYCRRRYNP